MSKASYTILGLETDSSPEQVKLAYRRLVAIYHPDRNPGDSSATEAFKLVCLAYRQIVAEQGAAGGPQARAPTKCCKRVCRRKRRGSPSDRRYNWQAPYQYIGTKVNCQA
ncbi:J domain-containing protein [Teredinibacter haidensis]|mgnify:CR=1 FL=1|uniref:J domain-containing protein n=1 Tax=Teredinibacter haidensis TaxID=2731755 RepID=UPI000948F140|nr:J domain-containing protein [Teredinibacter haidensis]